MIKNLPLTQSYQYVFVKFFNSLNDFILKKNFLLQGISKEQVNVDVHDNTLVISGENKQEQKYQEGNTHIQERRFGSFTRSIPLPRNVKVDEISAKFNQGVLEVSLPKGEQTGKKVIINQLKNWL